MRQLPLFPPDPAQLLLEGAGGNIVHMVSIDPEQNRFRFYTISWGQNLWGEWTIQTTWGRIGGNGRSLTAYFESHESLWAAALKMVARRLARGYGMIAPI